MRHWLCALLILLAIATLSTLGAILYLRRKNLKSRTVNFKHSPRFTANISHSPSENKLRVLVIQDGAYTRFPEFSKYTMAVNKAYCEKWNYEYRFIEHDINELPPYWLKVVDVRNALLSDKYDVVMYIDMDACVTQFETSIEQLLALFNSKADIFIGEDINPLKIANSGVFMFRNTPFSKSFIEMWKSACVSSENERVNACSAWVKEPGKKWQCPYCAWAGSEYEQGVFNQLAKLYQDNVAILHRSFLSNSIKSEPCFVFHAMAMKDDERLAIFSDIAAKLKKEGYDIRLS